MDIISLHEKYQNLQSLLASYGKLAVAFSGGVDSTFLLYAAKGVLPGNVLAVTGISGSFPVRETKEAEEFCRKHGIPQKFVKIDEMSIKGFAENQPDRCYLCKKEIFGGLIRAAAEEGITVVAEGSNVDDDGDYRPGHIAIRELGVRSPLREAGLTKAEIRQLSAQLGLPTASKPSFACLATRFPYGERITKEKLQMVDAAEQYLLDLGFAQLRVRMHGDMARIELLSSDFGRFMQEEIRIPVYNKLKALGFSYISLDLAGYRTGSMNEVLSEEILEASR